jgi:hypothetical protein
VPTSLSAETNLRNGQSSVTGSLQLNYGTANLGVGYTQNSNGSNSYNLSYGGGGVTSNLTYGSQSGVNASSSYSLVEFNQATGLIDPSGRDPLPAEQRGSNRNHTNNVWDGLGYMVGSMGTNFSKDVDKSWGNIGRGRLPGNPDVGGGLDSGNDQPVNIPNDDLIDPVVVDTRVKKERQISQREKEQIITKAKQLEADPKTLTDLVSKKLEETKTKLEKGLSDYIKNLGTEGKAIEDAGYAFKQNPTLENASKLYEAIQKSTSADVSIGLTPYLGEAYDALGIANDLYKKDYAGAAIGTAATFIPGLSGKQAKMAMDKMPNGWKDGFTKGIDYVKDTTGKLGDWIGGLGRKGGKRADLSGQWIKTSESMSKKAADYQSKISGRTHLESYSVNGVKFDGVNGGVLLDAKSAGYKNFVNKDGEFYSWFKGSDSLEKQAYSQLRAAQGAPIQWHFQNDLALNATKKLFDKKGIRGITLIYTP